ncbi:Uncharacterised protein [Klebsiella pneumoniae]|nr:Uncharacterised protein [Klebsiella pneumoniae]
MVVLEIACNKIDHLLVTFRLLLDQFQRLVIAFKKQQTGDSGDQIAMLMLHGAQVIGVLLHLAELQAKGIDIVFAAKADHPTLWLIV